MLSSACVKGNLGPRNNPTPQKYDLDPNELHLIQPLLHASCNFGKYHNFAS